jgi:hypothetical protein
LKTEPRLAYAQLSIGIRAFERSLLAELERRLGLQESTLALRALLLMVLAWVDAANRVYLFEGDRSLVEYFDEVVVTCLASGGELGPLIENELMIRQGQTDRTRSTITGRSRRRER